MDGAALFYVVKSVIPAAGVAHVPRSLQDG